MNPQSKITKYMRSRKKKVQRKLHPRTSISKLLSNKEKEKILKSSQRKQRSTYRGTVIEVTSGFFH